MVNIQQFPCSQNMPAADIDFCYEHGHQEFYQDITMGIEQQINDDMYMKISTVPCMACLPCHSYIVTRGRLWNIQDLALSYKKHSLTRGQLFFNVVEGEYTSSPHSEHSAPICHFDGQYIWTSQTLPVINIGLICLFSIYAIPNEVNHEHNVMLSVSTLTIKYK